METCEVSSIEIRDPQVRQRPQQAGWIELAEAARYREVEMVRPTLCCRRQPKISCLLWSLLDLHQRWIDDRARFSSVLWALYLLGLLCPFMPLYNLIA